MDNSTIRESETEQLHKINRFENQCFDTGSYTLYTPVYKITAPNKVKVCVFKSINKAYTKAEFME